MFGALRLNGRRPYLFKYYKSKFMRRIQAINDTKIQYLSVADTKIYKVKDIDFHNLTIEATETDLTIADVPEDELFPVEEFGEFRVRLINGG